MTTLHHAMTAGLLMAGTAAAEYRQVDLPIGHHGSNGSLHVYLFDSRRVAMKVIDLGAFKARTHRNLGEALQAHNCVAGCNGGPFDQEGEPLGLVVADNVRLGTPNRTSDLAAGVLFQDGARLRIQGATAYFANEPRQTHHLLQSGPFLVQDGKAVSGLSTQRHARRTFIVTDGGNQWAIGYAPATSLAILAKFLADPKHFTPFQVRTALDLDGASSSAFWVKRDHLPFYLREIQPVRNAIGLIRR